jgi:hypothetical protein
MLGLRNFNRTLEERDGARLAVEWGAWLDQREWHHFITLRALRGLTGEATARIQQVH